MMECIQDAVQAPTITVEAPDELPSGNIEAQRRKVCTYLMETCYFRLSKLLETNTIKPSNNCPHSPNISITRTPVIFYPNASLTYL
jgi:hypothetical protein